MPRITNRFFKSLIILSLAVALPRRCGGPRERQFHITNFWQGPARLGMLTAASAWMHAPCRAELGPLGLTNRPNSWHSFRHTHATQLAEVGESLRTAQSLLGHSDLETTLNVYTHAIPDAQRHAVDKVAEVLFTNVHKISAATEIQKVN